MVAVQPPIFYGYKNQDPWIFKFWIFEVEQFFENVHLSNDKQKMRYAKTRVVGRALEYWNHYKSLHFRCHWSKITWERTKDLCIEFFPQYFCKDLLQPSHGNGNLQDQWKSIRQCNNAQLTHEESSIHQDLGNLMKTWILKWREIKYHLSLVLTMKCKCQPEVYRA